MTKSTRPQRADQAGCQPDYIKADAAKRNRNGESGSNDYSIVPDVFGSTAQPLPKPSEYQRRKAREEAKAAALAKGRKLLKGLSPSRPLQLKEQEYRGRSFVDCAPLLDLLFKKRYFAPEVFGRYTSPVLEALLGEELLKGSKAAKRMKVTRLDVDMATILTGLMIHEVRGDMKFKPVDRDGNTVDDPGWYCNMNEHPEEMHGIPLRRFKRCVEKLSQLKLIRRRDPLLWDQVQVGTSAARKKRMTYRWLLNVRWNSKLRAIAENITKDERTGKLELKGAFFLPWALRATLAVPPKGRKKDTEDGLGTLLVLLVLWRHKTERKGGEVRPKRRCGHRGYYWCDHTRQEWADLLHCTLQQFDDVVRRLQHVLADDHMGVRKKQKKLLRPRARGLSRAWNRFGSLFVRQLPSHPTGQPFVFPRKKRKVS